MISRYAVLAFLSLGIAGGQNRFLPYYQTLRTTTLSGTAEVVSIVNPLNDGRQLNIRQAFVMCSAACDFQIEMDGSAPTGTALPIVPGTKTLPASRATALRSSVTSSPRFTIPYSLPSSGTYPVSIGGSYSLPGDGSNSSFTVRMITTTGITVTIFVQWEEP